MKKKSTSNGPASFKYTVTFLSFGSDAQGGNWPHFGASGGNSGI